MQLNVVAKEVCYLFIWIPADYRLVKIKRNDKLWNNIMLPKLTQFYETCFQPEIVDSRLSRGMKLRDPLHIIKAKQKHDAKIRVKRNEQSSKESAEFKMRKVIAANNKM